MRGLYIIGLTGGIACGKSTVSGILRGLNISVIDADELSRRATADGGEALPLIRMEFGEGVFSGVLLDRKKLAALIFTDKVARDKLNAIVHPIVTRHMLNQLEAMRVSNSGIVVLDIPLLFEAKLDGLCDEIWCVSSKPDLQLDRLTKRDGISQTDAVARINSQMSLEEKEKLADRIVINNGTEQDLIKAVVENIDDVKKKRG